MFALWICFATGGFVMTTVFVMNQLVWDKESKMRETLKIMSLDRWAYALSYWITQSFFATLTAVSLFAGYYFAVNSEGVIETKSLRQNLSLVGGLILFGLNMVSMSMALSTLFGDSKFSTYAGMLLMFLPAALLFYTFIDIFGNSVLNLVDYKPYYYEFVFELLYILPHFSFGRILLDYLVNHGRQYFLFTMIMPLKIRYAWYA